MTNSCRSSLVPAPATLKPLEVGRIFKPPVLGHFGAAAGIRNKFSILTISDVIDFFGFTGTSCFSDDVINPDIFGLMAFLSWHVHMVNGCSSHSYQWDVALVRRLIYEADGESRAKVMGQSLNIEIRHIMYTFGYSIIKLSLSDNIWPIFTQEPLSGMKCKNRPCLAVYVQAGHAASYIPM